ncbi:MAG TPA: hypothetical protein DCE23_08285 [Firmicutes bacterium]|nr:hypothetical protein [Bacillota bacterium]
MTDIDTIKLEDDKDYIVIDIIEGYFYLTNIKNPADFCIRKLLDENTPELYLLDDKQEFNKALDLFNKKNKI